PFGDDPFFKDFNYRVPVYRQKGTVNQKVGAGTGFIISTRGYILTNRHVVADTAATYTALLSDGTQKSSRVIFRDRERSYVENRSEFGAVLRYATTPAGEKEALERVGFQLEEIVTMRKFRWVRSLSLIGLLDMAPYFICRRPPR
ncbi:MAG: trypsin-like peptidase domain-containing protein, partial [Candidatus Hydrogenedentota bacterium]